MEDAVSVGLISSSTKRFHSSQEGHFPSHFGDWCPQFWQKKVVLIFFNKITLEKL